MPLILGIKNANTPFFCGELLEISGKARAH